VVGSRPSAPQNDKKKVTEKWGV